MLQTSHKSTRKPETSVTPNARRTCVDQPQLRQTRAELIATNPTRPTDLRSGSPELPQVLFIYLFIFVCLSVPQRFHS